MIQIRIALALEHAKELKEFDKAEEAKQESTTEPAQTQEEPVSVPIPKQEEQAVQQTEQQEATPAGNENSNSSGTEIQPDGSYTNIYGETYHVGDVHVDPSGQKMIYGGYAGF